MLGKLFKYDFKAISRLNFPLTLLVIGITVLGSGAMKLIATADSMENSFTASALVVGCGIIVVMSFISIVAYAAICFISVYARYYKNFFTDEGYLTFTLPQKTHTLLISKVLAGALWQLIAVTVTVSMVFIAIAVGTAPKGVFIDTQVISEIFSVIKNLFLNNSAATASTVAALAFQQLASMLMIYLALTIGCTVARKQKILASVGFYFALNTALQILATVLMISAAFISEGTDGAVVSLLFGSSPELDSIMSGFMSIIAVFYFVVAAAEFFAANMIIKKKLNLS